jgi:DNA-binding HxlR family transcriptional regulator
MEYLMKHFNDTDKVTLALLLEEGRAKISELRFHLTITQQQIIDALNELRNEGLVKFEISTESYILL